MTKVVHLMFLKRRAAQTKAAVRDNAHIQVNLQARAQKDDGQRGCANLLGPARPKPTNDQPPVDVAEQHPGKDHA